MRTARSIPTIFPSRPKLPSPSEATCGFLASTGSCVAMPPTWKMWRS